MDVSLNNWLRHLAPEMVTSHLGLDAATLQSLPAEKLELSLDLKNAFGLKLTTRDIIVSQVKC